MKNQQNVTVKLSKKNVGSEKLEQSTKTEKN